MSRSALTRLALVAATILVAGIAFSPAAEAAKLSKAELAAWKQSNVSCKAEAKGKKVGGYLARRKYVKSCIAADLKGKPNVDVEKIMKAMDSGALPSTRVDSHM
jgi:hypothetical protein